MPEPWTIYLGGARPPSKDRVILADVLEAYCIDADFITPAHIVAAFIQDTETAAAERNRGDIRDALKRLGRLFLAGTLETFVRPQGGGPVTRLPAAHWEIDDYERRFATCMVDPSRWWDVDAAGTHWIFVDAPAFDAWLFENSADAFLRDVYVDPDAAGAGSPRADAAGPAPTAGAPADLGRFLRMDEVTARTGLSRSTVYERMKAGTFPRQRTNGGRIVIWLETEVSAWQAAQIGR